MTESSVGKRCGAVAATGLVLALTAVACGGSGDPPASVSTPGTATVPGTTTTPAPEVLGGTMPLSIGAGENRLSLIIRDGYAEDGWVRPFEDETGCTVTTRIAATADEMVQLMHTGDYDGASAPGNATTRIILAGDAAPVNIDLIKNYPDLSGFLKDQPYNTYRGTHYGIPQGWGANLLMWRPDLVQPDPDSWSAVFDPASPYAGRVAVYDDPIAIADAAVYLRATQPDLAIIDPYELTGVQFQAAVSLMKVQRGLVGRYWQDPATLISASGAGDVAIGTSWQSVANRINADPTTLNPVATVVPKEGSTGWSDTWLVDAKARNPNCMYLWLDFITRPAVQAQVATSFGQAPANPKACDEIAKTDPAFCDAYHATDDAFYSALAVWKVPLSDCGDARGQVCTGYDAWQRAWRQIRG